MKLHNTLSRKKEAFHPLREGRVYMYVCGLTPYDHAHIGHARTMVAFDVLKRYLLHEGYDVFHVQNITDVDDKILRRARERGEDPLALAEHFHRRALEGFDRLNILRADVYPRVSEHIPDIVETIKKIEERGFAYDVESGLYFDVEAYNEKYQDYGALSGQRIEEIKEKHRIEPAPDKKSPIDFALWKKTKPGEEPIGWDSPWGYGRPGWHIECSAMSMKYNNYETLDIHAGARDLIFPHHENEIAQSQAAFDKPFARYWLHSGFLTINGEKMSKSLGNFITLEEALERFHPMALRLFFISVKYSSPVDFSEEKVRQFEKVYRKLSATYQALAQLEGKGGPSKRELRREVAEAWQGFLSAMEDDLDTARALAALHQLVGVVNKELMEDERDYSALAVAFAHLKDMFFILGIEEPKVAGEDRGLKALLKAREHFRKEKAYEVSDKLRDFAREEGIIIDDVGGEQRVRFEGG